MLPTSFLASHGAKLQTLAIHFQYAELAFNSCPNLINLAFHPADVCVFVLLSARKAHSWYNQGVYPLSKMMPATPLLFLRKIKLPVRLTGSTSMSVIFVCDLLLKLTAAVVQLTLDDLSPARLERSFGKF